MCYTIFLAKVIGWFFFLTGLMMVLNHQHFKKTVSEFLSDHLMITLSGQMSILLGLIVVITHNVWISEWPVLITLVGWFFLLQGLMRTFFPEAFIRHTRQLLAKSSYLFLCWGWLLVGLYLIWASFSQNR